MTDDKTYKTWPDFEPTLDRRCRHVIVWEYDGELYGGVVTHSAGGWRLWVGQGINTNGPFSDFCTNFRVVESSKPPAPEMPEIIRLLCEHAPGWARWIAVNQAAGELDITVFERDPVVRAGKWRSAWRSNILATLPGCTVILDPSECCWEIP